MPALATRAILSSVDIGAHKPRLLIFYALLAAAVAGTAASARMEKIVVAVRVMREEGS